MATKEQIKRPSGLKEFEREIYDRALEGYYAIEDVLPRIRDRGAAGELAELQRASESILSYLAKNPDRITMAQKFVDYYQDRVASLAKEFADIEETGISTPEVERAKEKIREGFRGCLSAYGAQFDRLLSDRILQVDAELDVMQQNLKSEGIEVIERPASISLAKPRLPGGQLTVLPSEPSSWSPVMAEWPERGIPDGKRPKVITEKMVAGLLGIFLGWIGAHKFYRGKKWTGLFYALFFWTLIPGFVGFVEGTMYLFMPVDDYYKNYFRPDRIKKMEENKNE